MLSLILGAILTSGGAGGVSCELTADTKLVDPAKSVFVTLTLSAPRGKTVELPDLRDRLVGFQLAEDFTEEPQTQSDGSTTHVANWRFVPEACAEVYKLKPFAVLVDGGKESFIVGPVYFDPPAAREPVTGEMEVSPTKDLPPLSWKLVGWVAAAILGGLVVLGALVYLIKLISRKIKEHRMSPIERAWVELDRLLQKGLPGRGRYKDFYVELTLVVRRYIQRKYGIRAPNLTTEEFLREAHPSDALRQFLESADMVKFAGVEATPEMADEATSSARNYLKDDDTHRQPQPSASTANP